MSIPGSTVTLTMNGGHIEVRHPGHWQNSVGARTVMGLLVNGEFVDSQSATVGLMTDFDHDSDPEPYMFYHKTQNTYSGQVSVSLTLYHTNNTTQVCANSEQACWMFVNEFK